MCVCVGGWVHVLCIGGSSVCVEERNDILHEISEHVAVTLLGVNNGTNVGIDREGNALDQDYNRLF